MLPRYQNPTLRLVRFPFTVPVTCLPDDDGAQTELLILQEDSEAKISLKQKLSQYFDHQWQLHTQTYVI